MQAVKFLLVSVLAICATQCQGAEVPYSQDKIELRLFVENGAAIAKNLFKAVNSGLDQSKPHMDKILNELAPEAKNLIRKMIDDVRAKINAEEKRINYIFNTLTKALDSLKPIKSCSDKVSGDGKKLALATEREIVKIVDAIEAKHKKEIDNLKLGIQKTLKKARNLFDTEVDAVVMCLTPGRKDAGDCMNKELDKIVKGVTDVAFEAVVLLQTANDTLSPILSEAIEKFLPLLQKTVTDGKVILKTLTDCVSKLK